RIPFGTDGFSDCHSVTDGYLGRVCLAVVKLKDIAIALVGVFLACYNVMALVLVGINSSDFYVGYGQDLVSAAGGEINATMKCGVFIAFSSCRARSGPVSRCQVAIL